MTHDEVLKTMEELYAQLEDLTPAEDEAYHACLAIVRKKNPNVVRNKMAEFMWEYRRAYVRPNASHIRLGLNEPWEQASVLNKQIDLRQADELVTFLTSLAREPQMSVEKFARRMAKQRKEAEKANG